MPLYHFNLADHINDLDIDGTELASEASARIEAVIFAGSYLRDRPELIGHGCPFCVNVTDDDGHRLFSVRIDMVDAEAA